MKTFTVKKIFSMILILTFIMTLSSTNTYAAENTTATESSRPELTFTDLPKEHWAYPYIQYMVSEGIVNGYPDNTFKPEDPFSRAAFAKLLVLSFDLTLYTGTENLVFDVLPNHWAYPYVMSASDFLTFFNLSDGNTYFYPDRAASNFSKVSLS